MQPYTSSEELTKLNKHVQNPTFSTSIQHFQDFLREKPSRKLLQEALVSQPPMLASPSPSGGTTYPSSELYTDWFQILFQSSCLVLSATIGSLVLFTIIKNASQQCSTLVASEDNGNLVARLANCAARIKLISMKTLSAGHTQWK